MAEWSLYVGRFCTAHVQSQIAVLVSPSMGAVRKALLYSAKSLSLCQSLSALYVERLYSAPPSILPSEVPFCPQFRLLLQ